MFYFSSLVQSRGRILKISKFFYQIDLERLNPCPGEVSQPGRRLWQVQQMVGG